MKTYYRLTVDGYWSGNDYRAGGKKTKVSCDFAKKRDAEDKLHQFEKWAEFNKMPPYEMTITPVELAYEEEQTMFFSREEGADEGE